MHLQMLLRQFFRRDFDQHRVRKFRRGVPQLPRPSIHGRGKRCTTQIQRQLTRIIRQPTRHIPRAFDFCKQETHAVLCPDERTGAHPEHDD